MTGSPLEAAQSAFDAMETGEWKALAEMIDPEMLRSIRDREVSLLISWAKHRPDRTARSGGMTGYSYDDKPDPKLLAQYADTTVPAFDNDPTLGELAAMEPKAFVSQWLSASLDGPMGGIFRIPRQCVGVVTEGDTLAHVVYRPGVRDLLPDPWYVAVMSLRRAADGRWLLLPSRELLASAGIMHKLFRPPGFP